MSTHRHDRIVMEEATRAPTTANSEGPEASKYTEISDVTTLVNITDRQTQTASRTVGRTPLRHRLRMGPLAVVNTAQQYACDTIDKVNRTVLNHDMRALAGTLAHFATSTDELR